MKFIYRIGYYSGGFIIGLILLFFFLGGKKASCDYSPNARALKNIRLKERMFSENALQTMNQKKIDSSMISVLLDDGDVLFSESDTSLDSCKIYVIEGKASAKNLKIKVQNCDSIATILEAILIE